MENVKGQPGQISSASTQQSVEVDCSFRCEIGHFQAELGLVIYVDISGFLYIILNAFSN